MSKISELFSAKEQAAARRKAAKMMGLLNDRAGASLPDELWIQAVPSSALGLVIVQLVGVDP